MSAKPPCVSLTPQCHLVGVIKKMRHLDPPGRDVNAFLGVPYADFQGRFKSPETVTLWEGERDARKFGPFCPQDLSLVAKSAALPLHLPKDSMSESCLYLNVWTPTLDTQAKLPVMVFIHGGAFVFGFSNIYQGTAMATFHDVVFVSINYRIGAFGFLSSGDSSAPGNYGLLDMLEALRWVQRHITCFGGDPHNVTLCGESAGAISISWLVLSPLARGLFRRAISQSGSAFCLTLVHTQAQAGRALRNLVKDMGFKDSNDSKAVIEYVRSLPTSTIAEKFSSLSKLVFDEYILWDLPQHLYTRGLFSHDVDYLMGYNSHEGAMFVLGLISSLIDVKDKDSVQLTIREMMKQYVKERSDLERAFSMVMGEYFPGGDIENMKKGEMLEKLSAIFGEAHLSSPTDQLAQFQAKFSKGKTYSYFFSHRPDFSPYPSWVKADHGMEIFFTQGAVLANIGGFEFSQTDKDLSRLFMHYWYNFAKSGDPNGPGLPRWPTHNPSSRQMLCINSQPSVISNVNDRMSEFWQKEVPMVKEGVTLSKL